MKGNDLAVCVGVLPMSKDHVLVGNVEYEILHTFNLHYYKIIQGLSISLSINLLPLSQLMHLLIAFSSECFANGRDARALPVPRRPLALIPWMNYHPYPSVKKMKVWRLIFICHPFQM